MAGDTVERWLARALVASFLVNVLLAVWLWDSRQPEDVLIATREYVRTRVVYDTVKAEAAASLRTYRAAREVLTLTDTVEVERVLTLADTALVRDSVALAAADTALARADDVISALRRSTKPRRLQPFAEVLFSPYSREYVGRIGIDVAVSRRISAVAASEIRRDGPGFAVGVRYRF